MADPGPVGPNGRESPDDAADAPTEERFLLDVMLGTLARYLRMCGYDAAYAGDRDLEADDAILALAREEDRVLLTRDVALADRAPASVLLTERTVADQLAELEAWGLRLDLPAEPTRCGRCNGRLERIDDAGGTPEYAPDPDETTCWRCRDCGQVFWKGSHWDRVAGVLEGLED